ncbi:MAG: cytochrome ubiquinol oxidase subunit I [Candidatus Eisenbacteria bacterium]
MDLDVVLLSRAQFALTIMFHYIFPPLTIGLGALMVFMEGMYHKTRDRQYEAMARFWTKIFAVNFAMGVATGIVMEFQFGTNWATYSRFVGDIFGSALAAEGIFAFFLESGFLAVLVFGWDKVSPRMHLFSTIMVSLGSIFSAVWIVVANSWQQTPAGYEVVGEGIFARAELTDFWAVVFNPSSMNRLGHVLIGAFILGSFFAMSIAAYYILKNRHFDFAKKTFAIALVVATVFSLLQLVSGHDQAKTVAATQPAKMAAFEGIYRTTNGGATLYMLGFPNDEKEKVEAGIGIPGLLSFLISWDASKPVPGLDRFPREDWPPVVVSFQTYHAMVALGIFFIALTLLAAFFLWRGTLFDKRRLLWVFVFAVVGPYLANQLGWLAAEFGRQPWIVYGLLRTRDAVSKSVPASHVLGSIVLYSVVYLFLFLIWIYVMDRKIRQGPEEVSELPPDRLPGKGFFRAASREAGDSLTGSAGPER